MARKPDPLWEVAASLHRFQTRAGRWAYAEWFRLACARLRESHLDRTLRDVLLPLFPRAPYFPDFLTPWQSQDGGMEAGLDAIMSTPPGRVLHELALLDHHVGAPAWVRQLTGTQERGEFVAAIRAYYDTVVAPFAEPAQARVDVARSACGRDLLDGGLHRMLAKLGPTMNWRPPVLEVRYPADDRDLHLGGRGLLLVPSYFCWETPVSLADPRLPPVLFYPLAPGPAAAPDTPNASLTALLGRTRATVLCIVAAGAGATTGEIARAIGISASSASKHTGILRDAGLLSSCRHDANVLHTLTPTGACLLRPGPAELTAPT